jgi:hypothetical protein
VVEPEAGFERELFRDGEAVLNVAAEGPTALVARDGLS